MTCKENTQHARRVLKHGNMVKVAQYDLEMNFIKEYECIRFAALENNILETYISACISNKTNKQSAGGFKWKRL